MRDERVAHFEARGYTVTCKATRVVKVVEKGNG